MSYCRFSSDDWRSDVYVYPHSGGFWAVHVAGRRAQIDRSALPAISANRPTEPDAWFDQWQARHTAMSALLADAEYVDIGGPHDGASLELDGPDEAADALEWLAACGYHVPDGVIAALREEPA